MNRLAAILPTRSVAAYCCANVCARRFGSDDKHYVNKVAAKKVQDKDDDRWLEAEIDENINTPEERYAHSRELDLLRKMVSQLQKDNKDKIADIKEERDKEVSALRKEMKNLEQRLNSMESRK